jgi:hypothetical protein
MIQVMSMLILTGLFPWMLFVSLKKRESLKSLLMNISPSAE